jgi:hypothetical protein
MEHRFVPLPAEVDVVARSQWERRRGGPRYRCGPGTLGRVTTLKPLQTLRGWIVDLSTRGAGLLLTQPLAADTLLVLSLKSTSGDKGYELAGRVIHSTIQSAGDWLIGCLFADPLTPEDLDALL